MKLSYYTFHLPFQYAFTTARGTKTHQPTLVVKLEHFGLVGYGEAPAIPYYNVSLESMIAALESKKQLIETYNFNSPERFWHFLHHLLPNQNFLICALDIAAWDLYGKMKGQPLYKLWNTTWNGDIQTDYTIGIDSMDKMLDKIAAKPMPIYKIKVGMDDDIAILTTIRKTTDAVIRVDANSGWQIEQAIEKIKALRDLDIEFVEEPIERKNYTGMQQVFTNSVLPILADESCVEEKDMEDCATCFNGINIKLTKCGGLTPALSMIKKAKQLKLKVMVGCMNESTIGSAAMAHLSPQIDYIDMDGPLLLSEDLATGLEYNGANFSVSNEPGLGINITF